MKLHIADIGPYKILAFNKPRIKLYHYHIKSLIAAQLQLNKIKFYYQKMNKTENLLIKLNSKQSNVSNAKMATI